MTPGRFDFPPEKTGARFACGLAVCDEVEGAEVLISTTGYTAVWNFRRPGETAVALSATTANGKLTIGGTPYNILANFDLALKPGEYDFDLALFTADGKKLPVLTGTFPIEASAA